MEEKAVLYKKLPKMNVQCIACSHKCKITPGKCGICGVRRNVGGELFLMVYGKVAAMNVDPIEKKPLFHFLPHTKTFSIGTVGCNFRCGWCQNYEISQASKGTEAFVFGEETTPSKIVELAVESGCKSVAYTYNEPAIFVEFAHDVAFLAKREGLKNVFVTNGYFTKESLKYLTKDKLVDAMNIDLKSFDAKRHLKYCGAKLKPVLDTIRAAYKAKIHIEITTLVVPGVNDTLKELEKIAKFIAGLDKDIPWHISRFFPMYKMKNGRATDVIFLNKVYGMGKKHLNNVYIGNV